jgi:membrane protein required for colicin V production
MGATIMINFAQFNWFDYCLVAIVFLTCILGIIRGFLREFIALLAWIAAVFAAVLFTNDVAVYVGKVITNTFWAGLVSCIAIFIIVLIIGLIVNALVSLIVRGIGTSFFSRVLGAIFGCCRGGIIVLLVIFIIVSTDLQSANWYQDSQLSHTLQTISNWVKIHTVKTTESLKSTD